MFLRTFALAIELLQIRKSRFGTYRILSKNEAGDFAKLTTCNWCIGHSLYKLIKSNMPTKQHSNEVSIVHMLPMLVLFFNSAIGFGFYNSTADSSNATVDLAMQQDPSQLIIRGSAYLLALILCAKNFDSFFRNVIHRWAFLGMALYVIITMMWSAYPVKVVVYWGHFIGVSLSLIVASRYLVRHASLFFPLFSYGFGLAVTYSMMISLIVPDIGLSGERWQGSTANPNTLGAVCLISIWASLANVVVSHGYREKMISVLFLVISVVTLYYSGSKTSAIASVFVIAGMPVLLSMRGHDLLRKFAIGAVWLWVILMLFVGIWLFSPELLGLEGLLGAMGKDASLTGRTYLWDDAMTLIGQKPLFGWSFDHHMSANEYVEVKYTHFHNGYLDLIVRGGVVGAILTSAIIISIFMNIRRLSGKYFHMSISYMTIVLAILLHNMAEVSLVRNSNNLWMTLMMIYFFSGYLLRYSKRKKRKNNGGTIDDVRAQ